MAALNTLATRPARARTAGPCLPPPIGPSSWPLAPPRAAAPRKPSAACAAPIGILFTPTSADAAAVRRTPRTLPRSSSRACSKSNLSLISRATAVGSGHSSLRASTTSSSSNGGVPGPKSAVADKSSRWMPPARKPVTGSEPPLNRPRDKRRGGGKVLRRDPPGAEPRSRLDPADEHTPETLFDRAWALALLASVFYHLQEEYARAGKAALFEQPKFCLTGQRSAIPYAELAARLTMAENTLKTLVRRLRERYRELLRAEVAQTVATSAEIDEELQSLFRALG